MSFVEALLAFLLLVANLIGEHGESVQVSPTATPVVQPPSVEALVCAYDWPCSEALAIGYCESRFVATATGKLGEKGWYQLRPEFHQWRADALFGPGADLYDPVVNTAAAHHLYQERGWQPWSCARGAYS